MNTYVPDIPVPVLRQLIRRSLRRQRWLILIKAAVGVLGMLITPLLHGHGINIHYHAGFEAMK